MKAHPKMGMIISAIALSTSLLFTPTMTFAEGQYGFSDQETTSANNSKWMKNIPNYRTLSELSIPGTHDSMSRYGKTVFDQPVVQTQSMPLETQLKAGIRYLDIRVRRTGDTFAIHHGAVYQKEMFGDVLNTVTTFLKNNPDEVILMRVKEEYDAEPNSKNFEDIFKTYWNRYSSFFMKPTTDNPKLGDVRGKIIILQDFGSSEKFGIYYNSLNIQDKFQLVDDPKEKAIGNHLIATMKDSTHMYLNYISCNGITDAGSYISGGGLINDNLTPKAQAKYHNTSLWSVSDALTHIGIIAMDFPSSGTVTTGTTPTNLLPKFRNGIIDMIISKNPFYTISDLDI